MSTHKNNCRMHEALAIMSEIWLCVCLNPTVEAFENLSLEGKCQLSLQHRVCDSS